MQLKSRGRVRTAVIALVGAALMGSLAGTPAFAASSAPAVAEGEFFEAPDLSTWAQFEAELDARGISTEAKQTILEAARAGAPLLADDPTATPVSTEQITRGDFAVTVQTFADGSFIETGTEVPSAATAPGSVTPMSVDGCVNSSVSGGTKHSGCKVYSWVGSIAMSFFTTYTIYTNGNDRINSVSGENTSAPFYNQSGSSMTIRRSTEGSQGPATARYHVNLSAVIEGVPINTARNLDLNVGGNSAWETFS